MKNLILIFCCICSLNLSAQNAFKTTFESEILWIGEDTLNNTFSVANLQKKDTIRNLKFAKRIFSKIQILDAQNNMYYIDELGERKEAVKDFIGVCGTVPHYELFVKDLLISYVVFKDETFYDSGNMIPAGIHKTIAKRGIDEVLFINGKNEFKYTANFGVGVSVISPETIIFKKGEKFAFADEPDILYDQISFNEFHPSLKTEKNGLLGYYQIIDPIFKEVEAFEYYLAKFTLPSGKKGFLDIDGNLYYNQ